MSEKLEECRDEVKGEEEEEEIPLQTEESRLSDRKLQQKQKLADIREKQNQLLESENSLNTKERFNFLIQQTDIFRHFISDGSNMLSAKKKGRRSKKAEKLEDKLLVDQALETITPVRLVASPNFIVGGKMRDYQVQGLNWLIQLHDHGINGILADEMGLGKTLQTISLLGYLKNVRNLAGPHLVIVPKSTLANWNKEFIRWCPSLSVFVFHGIKEVRNEQRKRLYATSSTLDVLITTYEIAIIEKAVLRKFNWRYLIIDEAHRIKNENSILSKVVRMYNSNHRLLITGTPLQNNLHELWALLNFLLPEVFSSAESFDEWFNLEESEDKNEVTGQLHKILKPFLLRRLKSEVEKSLPPKKETKLYIGLSDMQRQWYTNILSKNIDIINGNGKESRVRLLNILMQLRKCCNHPYLFQGAEEGPPYELGPHIIENSGKMILLDRLLARLKENGSRVLIFSQMTRVLDILEDYMYYKDYEYCRIDGSTGGDEREESIEAFNAPNSQLFCFLLSTRAGGLGINLATADTVILFDSDWNPQVDLQAQDRAHRIGQTKPVHVYRFVTQNTVEEKIIERAEAKLYLDAMVIQQGRLAEKNKSLSRTDLMKMIKFGADKAFQCESSSVTDNDIDVILQHGEAKTKETTLELKQNANNLLTFSMQQNGGDASIYQFMGVNYQQKKIKGRAPPPKWVELPQREKRKNYTEEKYYGGAFSRKPRRMKKRNVIKVPKQPILNDFQFFPEKLKIILDKELAIWRKECEIREKKIEEHRLVVDGKLAELEKEKEKEIQTAVLEEREPDLSHLDAAIADVDRDLEFDDSLIKTLSKKDLKEKERLINIGFADWTKKEFSIFVRASEYYGRDSYEDIASDIGTKSKAEVISYAKVFWKKGKNALSDWKKIEASIGRGEKQIARTNEMISVLKEKVGRYPNPREELDIAYPNSRKTIEQTFTPEEDRFLCAATMDHGYGNWEEVKQEARNSVEFQFNWLFKSRSADDIAERVGELIVLIEKENEKILKNSKKTGKRAAPKGETPNRKRTKR